VRATAILLAPRPPRRRRRRRRPLRSGRPKRRGCITPTTSRGRLGRRQEDDDGRCDGLLHSRKLSPELSKRRGARDLVRHWWITRGEKNGGKKAAL